MTPKKRQPTKLELLVNRRDEMLAQMARLPGEIKAVEKDIADIKANEKNPIPKDRIIEFLKPQLENNQGKTYEELFKLVIESNEISLLRIKTRFKQCISRAVRDETLRLRDGRYFLAKK